MAHLVLDIDTWTHPQTNNLLAQVALSHNTHLNSTRFDNTNSSSQSSGLKTPSLCILRKVPQRLDSLLLFAHDHQQTVRRDTCL